MRFEEWKKNLLLCFAFGNRVTLGHSWTLIYQSLEFVAETRILMEMKIKNRWGGNFRVKQIDKHTFFF